MPFPLDSRVLSLLSVFDDTPGLAARYVVPSPCESRRYVYCSPAGDLEVTVWAHSGTAWVCLRGLLGRRVARALATVLVATDVSWVVFDATDLTLPSASGGTPLVALCATLSGAGLSVAVVAHENDEADDQTPLSSKSPARMLAASA